MSPLLLATYSLQGQDKIGVRGEKNKTKQKKNTCAHSIGLTVTIVKMQKIGIYGLNNVLFFINLCWLACIGFREDFQQIHLEIASCSGTNG